MGTPIYRVLITKNTGLKSTLIKEGIRALI
jgi:hypothetical protein